MSELSALRELTLTRLRILLREPEVVFWVFLFPAFIALGLGIAFSDPAAEAYRVGVERGSEGEAYHQALAARPELTVRTIAPGDTDAALRRGDVSLVVAGIERVVLRFDPTRPDGQVARILVEAAIQGADGAPPIASVAVEIEEIRQPGQRYIDWLIPGLIGFNLMSTGLWVVGFFVTQARQTRQLKRLIATPMRRRDFLLAQVLARFAFLVVEVPLLVIFAWLIFGVTLEGSVLALSVVVLVGAACFTGLGLLVASRVRTTEGVGGLINLTIMPMVVLSGVFFSRARFPEAAQPFIQALPLTALNDALRAVYNEGLPLVATSLELSIVLGWGIGSFLLALRWFRWQ